MINLSFFLAWKYLSYSHKDSNIAFMTRICFAGIALGTFALMLALIITNGFEKVIGEKIQGITSSIVICSPGNKIASESVKNHLHQKFGNQIKAIAGSSTRQIIIDQSEQSTVLMLKGIEPEFEPQVSTLCNKIIEPENATNLSALLSNDGIIIGHKTATHHHLLVGDTVSLLVPEGASKKKILLSGKQATIVGIFNIGLEEYDNGLACCSLDFFNELFDATEGVDQLALSLYEPKLLWRDYLNPLTIGAKLYNALPFVAHDREHQLAQQIAATLPTQMTVYTWKDLYPELASSLKLEKYGMFFVLALITLVAAMNMISLLFMQIQQKRRDIAILQSMGMSGGSFTALFLRIGLLLTFFASCTGLLAAAGVGYLLEQYPCIPLPDVYYVSYLPARMEFEIFIAVFVTTMLIGFFATWIPARRAQRINITHVLRHN